MGRLKIAVSQINAVVGDIEKNSETILADYRRAAKAGADLVVFPELSLCGYPPEDLLLKKHFVQKNEQAAKLIAEKMTGPAALFGYVSSQTEPSGIFNAAAFVEKGVIAGIYRKKNLPNYGVFDERRYFLPGDDTGIFCVRGEKFGVTVCEDIWSGEIVKKQKAMGARFLVNISASPFHAYKKYERIEMLAERSGETGLPVIYSNLTGGQDELVFDGGSIVFSSGGKLYQAGEFIEDFFTADLELKTGRFYSGEREEGQNSAIDLELIYRALVMGLRDYFFKNGFNKAVIGISGGIDSALTAVIASEAIGADNVSGISMPTVYSSEETKKDARLLAENLGISFAEFPIQDIFDTFTDKLSSSIIPDFSGLAAENIQSRIRGNLLMAYSNSYGHLVLTTGNKSELSVGYCTLYGDTAGGFCVLKDVYKTLVYQLSGHVNSVQGKVLIPQTIIDREPTAELRYGQKDSDSLAEYPVLDKILKLYIEEDKGIGEITALTGIERDVIVKITSLVDRSEYKRRQAPPGIKITPKSFGRDRRLPITNRYSG